MPTINVVLWFDTEDFVTKVSEDALLFLLLMLEERNIKATFKIVGEKARKLKEHRRNDIISKLKTHEIGYHTDMHSAHPLVAEYLEPFSFREGAYEFEKREEKGFNDVVDITGKDIVCYGQPAYSWAPQPYAVLKKWGIELYVDAIDIVSSGGKPFRYCDIFDLSGIKGILRMELIKEGINDAKKSYDSLKQELLKEEGGIVSIYYHPTEFSSYDYWDLYNFTKGRNTLPMNYVNPPLRPLSETLYYIDMLGEFLDYIKREGHAEFIFVSQIKDSVESSKTKFDKNDIKDLVNNSEQPNFLLNKGNYYSAADIFSLMSDYIRKKDLIIDFLYGPENYVESDILKEVQVNSIKYALGIVFPKIYVLFLYLLIFIVSFTKRDTAPA